MWILLATICHTGAVESCETLIWTKESFLTEEQCQAVLQEQTPGLVAQGFTWVQPRCVSVPGQQGA